MNGDPNEAGDSSETGVFGARVSEEKKLQLSQGHGEFCDVVVVQLEDALILVFIVAIDLYDETDQVPKTLNHGDGRSVDADTENVFNVQNFQ